MAAPRRSLRRDPFVARVVGTLFLCGAGLIAVSLVLPHPSASWRLGLGGIVGLAALTGVVLMVVARRIPAAGIHLVLVLGVTLVCLCVYFSGMAAGVYSAMFLWAVVVCACFFPGRPAAAHLVYLLAAYGLTLAALPPAGGFSSVTRWIITAFALAVASAVTSWIVARAQKAERDRSILAAIVEQSHDAVIGKDLEGTVTSWNKGAERLYGYTAAEICGKPISTLVPEGRDDEIPALLSRLARGEVIDRYESVRRAKDGTLVPVALTISPVHDENGEVIGASSVARDRSEQQRLIARLELLSQTDFLTGLANRRAVEEELQREILRAKRQGHGMCVAMIDLDHFKQYNDTHGHPAGDDLLRRAASAWRDCLRQTDTIARYGGEEFTLLLPDCSADDALAILDRIRHCTPADQTWSAGIAYWDRWESPDELLSRADTALYNAKREGRNKVVTAPKTTRIAPQSQHRGDGPRTATRTS